jgi:hypothetical protein
VRRRTNSIARSNRSKTGRLCQFRIAARNREPAFFSRKSFWPMTQLCAAILASVSVYTLVCDVAAMASVPLNSS